MKQPGNIPETALDMCKNMLRYLQAGPLTTRADRNFCIEELQRIIAMEQEQQDKVTKEMTT